MSWVGTFQNLSDDENPLTSYKLVYDDFRRLSSAKWDSLSFSESGTQAGDRRAGHIPLAGGQGANATDIDAHRTQISAFSCVWRR